MKSCALGFLDLSTHVLSETKGVKCLSGVIPPPPSSPTQLLGQYHDFLETQFLPTLVKQPAEY